jgi:hypothetical protein
MSLQLSRDIQLLSIYSRIKVYHKLDILVEKKLSTEVRSTLFVLHDFFSNKSSIEYNIWNKLI